MRALDGFSRYTHSWAEAPIFLINSTRVRVEEDIQTHDLAPTNDTLSTVSV